jgi:hypothetical protein
VSESEWENVYIGISVINNEGIAMVFPSCHVERAVLHTLNATA